MALKDKGIFNKLNHSKVYILWVIVILLTFYFIYFVVKSADKQTHGFSSYYTASRLLIEGEDVSKFYDDDYFSSKVEKYVPGIYEIYLVNPPTTSFMLLPVVSFDYSTARIIWMTLNFIILVFTLFFFIKKFQFSQHWVPITIIIFLIFQPLYANFSFGQAYVLIFGLMVIAWYAYRSDNQMLFGLVIGFMIIIKAAGIIFFLLMIIKKKWKALFWSLSTIVLLMLLTLPFMGIDSWINYLRKLMEYSSAPSLSVTAYQTIHSFFHHIFVFNQQWNPEPIFNLPALGITISMLTGLLTVVVVSVFALRVKSPDLTFGAFIIAGVILSPVSLDYHYILMLIPVLIFFERIRKENSKILWIVFLVFFVLMAAPISYTSSKVTGGLWAFLAYPKLYGAIGILGLYILTFFKPELVEEKVKRE